MLPVCPFPLFFRLMEWWVCLVIHNPKHEPTQTPKQVYASVKGKHSQPPVSLMGQLLWREFYYLAGHGVPNFDRMVGNPICKQIPWGRCVASWAWRVKGGAKGLVCFGLISLLSSCHHTPSPYL